MASKRKNDEIPTLTGREKKKQKTALARTIAVQPNAGSGSEKNAPSQNAEAGPSRSVHFDSKAALICVFPALMPVQSSRQPPWVAGCREIC